MQIKHSKLFLAVVFVFLQIFSFAQAGLQLSALRCEYIINPLGIDVAQPCFSWACTSRELNKTQTAYEIMVSKDEKELQENNDIIWSSGKIISSQSVQIKYNGKPLQPFTRYYWKVKVYDENGTASAWSKPAWFETAMLNINDWSAKWINDGSKNPDKDEDYYKQDRMPLFRKEFSANKKIASARLYISGLGYYEAYLNGKKIGDHVLDPGFTTYRKEVLYAVYDITVMVKRNKNILGIMLGDGWWNPLPLKLFGRWDLRNYQQSGRPCVKAELHIHYADGSIEKIVTDESWLTAPGPVTHNNVYLGEKYDARLEQKNWSIAGADKSVWKNAVFTEGPAGTLTAQMQPPIRVTKIIEPVKITEPAKDTFIVDMGQNFAGVAQIKIKAAAGTKISLRYGEALFKDGHLNYLTTVMTQIKKGVINGGPGAPETAWQQDEYICKGDGIETWSPRFTFHGFRYVEITGWPGKPTLNDIRGFRMNSDVARTGTFECSDQQLNKLHEVIQWTFLSNIFSVQSDCPAREKMGYGADMVVTANSFMYNYDMSQFYRKAVKDFANEQRPEGGITEIAPFTGIDDRGYGDGSGPVGWELAFPYLQKQLYEFYGDKKIIEENYEAIIKQINFLQSKTVDGLLYWGISDHEALDPKPEAFTSAAFYYHHIKLAEEFAGILNKKDDSIKYSKLAEQIKNSIIKKFLVTGTGRFDNATQSAQIFALWYCFSPEKDASWKVLMNEFARHDWHVATGIFSTKMMFDVFRENNASDTAYKIAMQQDYPGWLNMTNSNATTLWETWAYPENFPSQNHPMFGSIDEWFYRSILGINSAAPGFEKIIIKPQPAGDLTWAKGSYQSIKGEIVSEWKRAGNNFSLHVVIPANTTAKIYIPSNENNEVTESGKAVNVKYENGYGVSEIGSGVYNFKAIWNRKAH
ncbi:MAG: glycoside hydrolase family 78 protein [Bacteroidota bacterium]|nr:glycoside hydrolase family 78 protein [Bacteroidota bacterium]